MSFEPASYLHLLSDIELPDVRKLELVEHIWTIAVSFVDAAWDGDRPRSDLGIPQEKGTGRTVDAVKCETHLSELFQYAAKEVGARESRR